MKKFISIFSSAAIAATMLVPIAAGAAGETVLYSDSFNGYPTSVKGGGTTVFAALEGGEFGSVADNPDWTWIFESPSSQTLGKLTVGFEGTRGDDTAAVMIKEKETAADKYLSIPKNRFQSRCTAQITGFDGYTANEGEELVIAFDVMLKNGSSAEGIVMDLGCMTLTTEDIPVDTWAKVKAVISGGSTTVYVNNVEKKTASGVVSMIKPVKYAADTKLGDGNYSTINLDNLVILSATDGATAEIPKAEDQEEATPIPTATPKVVNYEKAAEYDFDNTTVDVAVNTNGMAASVVDGTDPANMTKVLQLAATSTSSARYAMGNIDISALTLGKSDIKVEYDAYIASGGRMLFGVSDAVPAGYNTLGYFTQGYNGTSPTNTVGDTWVHTTIEADVVAGTGTYLVTNGDAKVASGALSDIKAVNYINFTSWSTNTSYIDNIVVSVAGEAAIATPEPTKEPEPAATVEGSYVDLKPANAQAEFARFANATAGTGTQVLNHSDATAVTNETSVSLYSDSVNIRGKVVAAQYDVLVDAGDVVNASAYNGSSLGPQFIITGNADGTATAAYCDSSKGNVNIEADLRCNTWYRVKIELPQVADGDATYTGSATYTIYRIDPNDTDKTVEVAAAKADIGARNLYNRAATSIKFAITGTPYLDNGVTYLVKTPENTWYRYHYTTDADTGVRTVTSIEEVDEPSKNGPEAGKSFVWNALMQPYVAPAAE